MKLRASLFAFLLLAPALVVLGVAGTAAAANGDTLLHPGATPVTPGNPCNVMGLPGGVAVDENAKRLYYTVRNQTRIYNASTLAPYACSILSTNVPASAYGFTYLAFDKTHATVRFWAAANTTLYGLNKLGTIVTSNVFSSNIVALELDESSGTLLVGLAGLDGGKIHRYTTSYVDLGNLGFKAENGLSTWQGGHLASDATSYVRLYAPTGIYSGFGFRPGWTSYDQFFQPFRNTFPHRDTAFDESSYGPTQGALYLMHQTQSTTCIADCPPPPQYECVRWEGSTCLELVCVANCNSSGGVFVTTYFPHIRAVSVVKPCPNNLPWIPCGPDPCQGAPVPLASIERPTADLYVRNEPHAPASFPILVGPTITINVSDPTGPAGKVLQLTTPSGTLTSSGANLSATVSTATWPRGLHTIQATVSDATGCRVDSETLDVWFERPTIRTRAQTLRVEGNVPLNLVAGTLAIEPADTLLGRETYAVADRSIPGARLSALVATARHDLDGTRAAADATTDVVLADAAIDLQALCWVLINDPTVCPLVPSTFVGLDGSALGSDAHVEIAYLSLQQGVYGETSFLDATGNAWTSTTGTTGAIKIDENRASATVGRTTQTVLFPPLSNEVGPFVVLAGDVRIDQGPLHAEVTATALRVLLDSGGVKGEIVIGESYAGVSFDGPGLLVGPPDPLDAPDDFDTGADSPADPALGPTLGPGVFPGLMRGDDRNDSFRVPVTVGQKLKVALQQGHRVGAFATPAPTLPSGEAAIRLMRLELYDPNGVLRDSSTLGLDAHTAEVELNVDVSGSWRVRIDRMDARDGRAPYTVAIGRTPVALPADEGAGSTCATALPLPATGAATGALDASDPSDTWRFSLASAKTVAIVLAHAEPEGADFDLELLNAGCGVLATSATHGPVKGAPEILSRSLPAGTYYVRALRTNGIGAYAIAVEG